MLRLMTFPENRADICFYQISNYRQSDAGAKILLERPHSVVCLIFMVGENYVV